MYNTRDEITNAMLFFRPARVSALLVWCNIPTEGIESHPAQGLMGKQSIATRTQCALLPDLDDSSDMTFSSMPDKTNSTTITQE